MAGNIVQMDDSNYKEILKSHPLVIVDTWAEWCAPCKAIAPVFERLAAQYSDRLTFAKVNTDENLDFARSFKVLSIPTFLVFKNGELVNKWSGAKPEKLTKEVKKLAEDDK
ncbi:MAG: thioredoxin [Methanobacteriota archaeon]|nr:MAG: thioredoxin [Euryarchaeota archaeon]